MNAKPLAILGVCTALVVAGAIWVRGKDRADTAVAERPERLFPGLEERINELRRLVVRKGETAFSLERKDQGWVVPEKGGYPANGESVRKLALALALAAPVEALTKNPQRYPDIDVEDPGPGGASVLVALQDAAGAALAELIVGQSSYRGGNGHCVRRAGDPQAWKIGTTLDVEGEASGWLQKEILKVDRARLQTVTVTPAEGAALQVTRAEGQTDFTIVDLPAEMEPKYPTAANSFMANLEYLELEDVMPQGAVDLSGAAASSTEFRCYDGLVVTARVAEKEGKYYASFAAGFVEPPPPAEPAEGQEAPPARKPAEEVEKEALELNARVGSWLYVLPSYKASQFRKKLDDLAKPKEPATAAEDAGAPLEEILDGIEDGQEADQGQEGGAEDGN